MTDNIPQTPQYPKWVRDIIDAKVCCPQCSHIVQITDIHSIGTMFPDDKQVVDRSPLAQVVTHCPQCGQRTGFEMHVDKLPLLSAAETLYDRIEVDREFTESTGPIDLPSPNIKPPRKPTDSPFDISSTQEGGTSPNLLARRHSLHTGPASPTPKYPRWVHDAADGQVICPECDRMIQLDGIRAIGVQYPETKQVHDRRPVAFVMTYCEDCDGRISLVAQVDKSQMLSAVETLYDYIEAQRPYTEVASPFAAKPHNAIPKSGERWPAAVAWAKRRRRQLAQLAQPPTDKETQVFLNRLKRTSFKRSSKSFEEFMWLMGIDIRTPNTEQGESS